MKVIQSLILNFGFEDSAGSDSSGFSGSGVSGTFGGGVSLS